MKRVLLLVWIGAWSVLQAQAPPAFHVREATIAGIHAAMKAGQVTCRGLVEQYLRRIDAYDRNGPALNAIVLTNPQALSQADAMDRRFTSGGLTGPLHCIPTIVKDNFETIGLGSDTGNSIRGPSSHQALVGIRSTMGLTSRAGVMPLNLLADIAGPMTRSVEDAAAMFQIVAGEDPDDPATAASRGRAREDYSAALRRDGLRGARIGILRQAYERDTTDAEIVQVFMTAVEDLQRAGAVTVDPARVPLDDVRRAAGAGPCMGFKDDINRYLATHGDRVPVKSLAEIVKSGRFHPTVQRRLEQAEQGAENGPDTPGCTAEQEYRARVREAVVTVMDEQSLDAFLDDRRRRLHQAVVALVAGDADDRATGIAWRLPDAPAQRAGWVLQVLAREFSLTITTGARL